MTKEYGFTHTGAGDNDVQGLRSETAACNLVEYFQVKRNARAFLMIQVVSLSNVFEIIMSDAGAKADRECIFEQSRHRGCRFKILIDAIDGFRYRQVQGPLFTELFCLVNQPLTPTRVHPHNCGDVGQHGQCVCVGIPRQGYPFEGEFNRVYGGRDLVCANKLMNGNIQSLRLRSREIFFLKKGQHSPRVFIITNQMGEN